MHLLFLNDFGTSELIFIMLAVLLLFGANSIPSIAKTLGKGMREIKQASDEIKRDITASATQMRRDMNMEDSLESFKEPLKEIERQIVQEPKKTPSAPPIDKPIDHTKQDT